MKSITYDVPAYKFDLVFPCGTMDFNGQDKFIGINRQNHYIHGEEQSEKMALQYSDFHEPYFGFCRDEDYKLLRIPFIDVDGLTIEELLNLTSILGDFARYDHSRPFYDYPNHFKVMLTGYFQGPNNYMDMHLNEILLPSYWQEEKRGQRFDKVIEQILEEDYNRFQGIEQKMADCFFARYQDDRYEDTYRRVMTLKQSR